MSWNCARCSFSNHPDLRYCELCEFSVDSDVRSTSVSSATVISLMDSPCGPNTSDHYILPQGIRQHALKKEVIELKDPVESVIANNLSHEPQKKSRTLVPIQGCAHAVPGILQLIRQSMTSPPSARSKVRCEYVVSSPPCLHVSQKGSYGSAWSCGYRNIQMLCSSLMQLEEYRNVLFDGTGVVPEINGIQRWIETAWKAGFDVEGAMQLNHRLLGYSKWIGATECAALLRYFGIRAVIVDFPEGVAIRSDQQHPVDSMHTVTKVTGKRPFESTAADPTEDVRTVHNNNNNNNTCSSSGGSGVLTTSERIVRWAERYFNRIDASQASQGRNDDYFRDTFLPPVYCQHQGHSRTIVGLQYSLPISLTTDKLAHTNNVGINSSSSSTTTTTSSSTSNSSSSSGISNSSSVHAERKLEQLLVFNPSSDATLARDSLIQGTLRWRPQLCKNLSSFQKDSYQLVYIAPGIMTEQERLRSRVLIGAIVADLGSFSTRIGFAGEDTPRAYIPSMVGVLHSEQSSSSGISESTSGASSRDFVFDLNKVQQNMGVESPVRDGLVTDWDLLEKLWEHSIVKYCGRSDYSMKDTPVLLGEKPYTPAASRHRMCETMFEKYSVPAFFLSKDAVLASYACGKTGGLVIDVGASGTVVTPVQDGWVDTKGMCRTAAGGRLIDAHIRANVFAKYSANLSPSFRLNRTLSATSPNGLLITPRTDLGAIHPSYDAYMRLELCRDVKESLAKVADSALLENDPRYANIPMTQYELPDGTIVDVNIERFQISELLFDPSPMADGVNSDLSTLYANLPTSAPGSLESVPKVVGDAIVRSDADMQTMLLSNLILTGGCACIEGLSERLKTEVERLMYLGGAPGYKTRMVSVGVSERALCPWLGGSIVASLGSFHELWVSKQEYEEFGTSIIDRKCP